MTIRAKLYVAILLTVIGPVITVAVALHGMARLGERFDEVQERADQRALALDLKFGVTDFNGWQTAYGYDDGVSRPRFERSVTQFRADYATARKELNDRRETRLLREIGTRFDQFMALDDVVEMDVDEIQPRRGAPLPEQPRLDVFPAQRFAQQRIVEQVDLADREVVRRAPIAVKQGEFGGVERGAGRIDRISH